MNIQTFHYDSGRDARTDAPAFLDVFMATERMSSRVLAPSTAEDKRKGGVPVLGRSVGRGCAGRKRVISCVV